MNEVEGQNIPLPPIRLGLELQPEFQFEYKSYCAVAALTIISVVLRSYIAYLTHSDPVNSVTCSRMSVGVIRHPSPYVIVVIL